MKGVDKANDTINKELINNYNIQMKQLREKIQRISSSASSLLELSGEEAMTKPKKEENPLLIEYIEKLYKEYGYSLLYIEQLLSLQTVALQVYDDESEL